MNRTTAKRIALILNDDFSMYHFRGGLIRGLVARGHSVTAIVPPGEHHDRLRGLGARVVVVPMARFLAPWRDLRLFVSTLRLLRRQEFDILHTMTIKPNIFCMLAATLAGVPRRCGLVSGLGFLYTEGGGLGQRIARGVASLLYRIGLHGAHKVWFQNPDDLSVFLAAGIVSPRQGICIRSGGINLDEFAPERKDPRRSGRLRRELGLGEGDRCVLMVAARMVWSKGVRQFVEAGLELLPDRPGWHFVMVCPRDEGTPDAVPRSWLAARSHPRLIVVDTFQEDIYDFVAESDVMVLPSYYREGVPRTLLEGMAMAKPIVTTDHPGCRETVDHGRNGYLVSPVDTAALAERVGTLMDDDSLRREFGRRSRRKAEAEFAEELVVGRIVREVYGIEG